MDYAALLKMLQRLNELMHAKGHLLLFELVHFDMVKQFSTGDLLHDDVHVLFCFVSFSHLHNARVR